jgi:hypothetical protein
MGQRESIYLDLQDERDRARIADPNVFFKTHPNALIVLDEVHTRLIFFATWGQGLTV